MNRRLLVILTILLLLGSAVACTPSETSIPTIPEATATIPPTEIPTEIPTSTPTTLPTATATATIEPTETSAPTPTPTLGQVVLAPGNLSAGDPFAPELGNRGYDAQRYTLALSLDPGTSDIEGNVSIEAASTIDGLRQVSLDFIGFEIEEISMNGMSLSFFREEGKLIVNLPEAYETDSTFTLDIAYSGAPTREPSIYVPFVPYLGLQNPESAEILFVVAEPDGARYWFPVNDHPRDKAVYRFELIVPEGLVGVANGALVEIQEGVPQAFSDGRAGDLFIWEHEGPMASAFVTVAAGDYERVESASPNGVPIRSYVFPGQRQAYENAGPKIGEMVDWMSDTFGAYPFEAFGYLSSAGLGASLETQTMVVFSEDAINNDTKLAHEMAHMWFGDWVSLDSWGDMWRSEGFATYIADMWLAHNDPQALDERMDFYRSLVDDDPSGYPLNDPPPGDLFGRDSYIKGAVLVHDLRQTMGDEAFFSGLQSYFDQYGGVTATHAEFQAVMEEASGMPLDDFFAEWFE